jgi:DNA-binding ferritin-like protein (Dps family)
MQLDRTDYTPFMDGVKEIFLQKMAKGKASKIKGWSARTMMDELIEEQNLTEGEQEIAWAVLTHDILGYTDHKIKELEDAWQKARKEAINQGTAQQFTKNVKRSSNPLSRSSQVD